MLFSVYCRCPPLAAVVRRWLPLEIIIRLVSLLAFTFTLPAFFDVIRAVVEKIVDLIDLFFFGDLLYKSCLLTSATFKKSVA
jgi:hypothetical protein